MNNEITKEEMIRHYAKNRYDMRVHFNWRMNDTPEDDWRIAKELVERHEKERLNGLRS